MGKFLRILSFTALLSCMGFLAFGQGVTTSALSGKISNKGGETLPGATVVALHTPTGTKYGISTRFDGRYTLPNLRVGGPYTITISFVGYQEQKFENVFLKLGQTLNLNVELADESSTLEEVVVTGEGDTFNSGRTGAANNFDNEVLRKMPTITRSASDIYRLTPASDGNSFGGRNDQFNNFSLDGSIFNNPFGLDAATPGGQSNAQPVSLDAIDEIQVSLAPYDVTQAGFTGAAVNAVTKSGTNSFEGTVFAFYRNQDMTGSKVDGSNIFVPDLRQLQSGFSLGGPIVKDKLFFFANLEIERREDLGSNFRASRPGVDETNVSRVLAADLDAVSNALAAIGYQTGPYEGYTHDTNNEKGILKLDWNISQNHTLTATYNFLNAFREQNAHPSALGLRGPNATTLQFFNSGYRINNKIQSGIVELKSLFGSKFSNKLQVGYTHFDDSRDPFSAPAPVLNIAKDGTRYIIAGHEPFSINNRLDQKVFQFSNNFDIYAGKHTFTVGTSLERFAFDNSFNLGVYEPFGFPYPGGTFAGPGFASVEDFLAYAATDQLQTVFTHAQTTFDNNNANNSWALAETNVGQFALYAQDKWDVTDNFSLTIGLRMDMPLYFDTDEKIQENIDRKGGLLDPANGIFDGNYAPSVTYYDENNNAVQFDHTVLPDQTPLISPRIGFNYNKGGLQVRGGSGLFSGRLPFVWIGNQVANPDFFFYTMTANNFKFPQVWRTNIGADKSFGQGWVATADVIYTRDINSMLVRNYGLRNPSGTLAGVDNRPTYDPVNDRAQGPFGGPTNAYVFTNADEGRSINLTLELKRNWANGLYTSLAYNYLDAKDLSSIEAEISGDAYDRNPVLGNSNNPALTPSLYGNKHRIVGSANKRFEYGNGKYASTISLFFEYAQGGRFSYTYSGDINGDGSPLNDLLYIPTNSDLNNMIFSGDETAQQAQRTAYGNFIAQDDYLSENRGGYVEKYAILSPWFSRWDIRFLQDLNISEGNTFQLSVDLLNAGNFISSSWGVRQIPTNVQPVGVVGVDDASGQPIYSFDTSLTDTFVDDFSLLSRWQLQVGLRYIFK